MKMPSDLVELELNNLLPSSAAAPEKIHQAIRWSVFAGGKRMRPLLVYATGIAFGADEAMLDAPAAAVELIHAYSLVHDDLPAMDDDALRRGKPTVHVAFDEATAILAGDALQSLAFELLAASPLPAEARVAMLHELSVAAGARGMCGGQALDIDATGNTIDIDALQRLHALKTGALLRASVRLGAIAADIEVDTLQRLDMFADALGLAFQIRDDLLDIEGDSATLGKTAGKDIAQAKATFPALIGIDASRARLHALAATMHDALAPFGARADMLAALARQAIARNH
jgi:farnesyl diphosphate synthase